MSFLTLALNVSIFRNILFASCSCIINIYTEIQIQVILSISRIRRDESNNNNKCATNI